MAVFLLSSCSPYSKLSKHNKFDLDDSFVVCTNELVNLQSSTFGDFKFASNLKEFKKVNANKKPGFKNVLLYAKTNNPEYEYYLLLNENPKNNPDFIYRAIAIDNNRITLVISKSAPVEDIEIIANKITVLKNTTAYNNLLLQNRTNTTSTSK